MLVKPLKTQTNLRFSRRLGCFSKSLKGKEEKGAKFIWWKEEIRLVRWMGREALLHPGLAVGFPRSLHQPGPACLASEERAKITGRVLAPGSKYKIQQSRAQLEKNRWIEKSQSAKWHCCLIPSVQLSSSHFCVCLNYLSVGDFITRVNQTDRDQ